jgi:predicted nucleic acid-binding protein
VTFVDTNVVMYAVGREHPLRAEARAFFTEALRQRTRLATSAEVLQELLHAYLPADRLGTMDRALELLARSGVEFFAVEPADVLLARALAGKHPELPARDLLHLACVRRREIDRVRTFDRALAAAARRG